jgi:hypothetical protein
VNPETSTRETVQTRIWAEIVAEKIYRMTRYVGVTYLNCTFNLGQVPHAKIMLRSHGSMTSTEFMEVR